MKYFFLMFLVVALLAAATTLNAQLPTVPPHRQLRPSQPPSLSTAPSVAPAATGPSPVFGAMQRIDAKATSALAKANQALAAVRRGRHQAAPSPPSPLTAAMGDAADAYSDNFEWSQALLRNNGDEALARIDPGYQAYLQVRQDPAHQTADAKAYAGLIGYDHAKVMDMKYQIAVLQSRISGLEKSTTDLGAAVEANDQLIRTVANNTALLNGILPDGAKPSKKEKKSAAAWLAGL